MMYSPDIIDFILSYYDTYDTICSYEFVSDSFDVSLNYAMDNVSIALQIISTY